MVAFVAVRCRARKERRVCAYSRASISRVDVEDAICGSCGWQHAGTKSEAAAGEEREEVAVAVAMAKERTGIVVVGQSSIARRVYLGLVNITLAHNESVHQDIIGLEHLQSTGLSPKKKSPNVREFFLE